MNEINIEKYNTTIRYKILENDCWESLDYKRAKINQIYPRRHVYDNQGNKSCMPLAKILWESVNHEVFPPEKIMCHLCDNPWCINPDHIVPGTYKENSGMITKKRADRGGDVYDQIREIYKNSPNLQTFVKCFGYDLDTFS